MPVLPGHVPLFSAKASSASDLFVWFVEVCGLPSGPSEADGHGSAQHRPPLLCRSAGLARGLRFKGSSALEAHAILRLTSFLAAEHDELRGPACCTIEDTPQCPVLRYR